MNKYFTTYLVLVVCVIYTTADTSSFLNEYYWKDYQGIIPPDALIGGQDRRGKPIYVGQALHENKLIPGKIYTNNDKIYFEWATKEVSTNQNVKILCSIQPQKFKWHSTRSLNVTTSANKIFINGGFEPNYDTYIGRAVENGETTVGKVICSVDDCLGLITTYEGKTRTHKIFQILTFDPKVPTSDNNCLWPIDVRIAVE